jgi:hypothetical protein
VYEAPLSHEISSYHSSVAEESGLLGCDTVLLHGKFPVFLRIFFANCLILEDEGITILQNVKKYVTSDASLHRRYESPGTLPAYSLWENRHTQNSACSTQLY